MDVIQVKALLAQLVAAVNEPEAGGPLRVEPDAPFGRNADGSARFAPAYDACRAMWEAAGREGVFSLMSLIGGGIKPLAAQMYQDFVPDLVAIEKAILALGFSPWGQEWLKHDENAAMIGRDYCKRFVGYYVSRVHQNDPSQGFRRVE